MYFYFCVLFSIWILAKPILTSALLTSIVISCFNNIKECVNLHFVHFCVEVKYCMSKFAFWLLIFEGYEISKSNKKIALVLQLKWKRNIHFIKVILDFMKLKRCRVYLEIISTFFFHDILKWYEHLASSWFITNLEVLRMNLCFKRSKLCNPPTSSHHQTCYAFHTFLFFLQLLFSLVGIRNLSKVSMQFRAIRNLIEFYKDTYIYDKIDLFFQIF